MPIRWSGLTVAKAMDEVENLLNQADPFLAEAETKARKATGIACLPQYMDQRLHRLAYTIEDRRRMREATNAVRNAIPQDAIEAERQAGRQQAFSL